ncbi:MAG: MBL fold metallo-hydrolase [Planctomycetales bacterium]|nr:MBL fold metallo-hydrolase [Planctomycetales bacterium]
MKIHFLGANRQVTGSRYCLETRDSRVMIDCGMFQERQFLNRNWNSCPLPLESIDAMLVTHAHIDHCGLIPRLVRQGFRSPIYSTEPTTDLLEIMLRDAAKIQAEDYKYKKKRHLRENRKPRHDEQVLFDDQDVDVTLPLRRGVKYNVPQQITPDIRVTFWEAGHILGSAMLDINVQENGKTRRVIFSGDIGQWDKPLIHDPSVFSQADYVVMESTYGDRNHEDAGEIEPQLERVIRSTIAAGGNVVIPTFAVERAQELIYHISNLAQQNLIPDVPVFLDSPMAVDVTDVFRKNRDRFDAETWNRINQGMPPLDFRGLRMSHSTEESKAINAFKEPCVIMSTAGMCTAGRIKHHLRHNISRPESTILFVGYQAHGTLGRLILEGTPEVRIHGQSCKVRAKVQQIYGCSGHADRSGLLFWASHFKQAPRRVFLTHGEEKAAQSLADALVANHHWNVLIPDYESASDLK